MTFSSARLVQYLILLDRNPFIFSYLSAYLEKNMVTDDSRKMTLGVMKMAHDFSSNEGGEEVRKFF